MVSRERKGKRERKKRARVSSHATSVVGSFLLARSTFMS